MSPLCSYLNSEWQYWPKEQQHNIENIDKQQQNKAFGVVVPLPFKSLLSDHFGTLNSRYVKIINGIKSLFLEWDIYFDN